MSEQPPADWYPDPFGRHERRYWDGSQWTAHVTSRGLQGEDSPVAAVPASTPATPAGWHPDPFGRHDTRYWDGATWTEHVASRGLQGVDPPVDTPPVPADIAPAVPEEPAPAQADAPAPTPAPAPGRDAKKIQRQMQSLPRVTQNTDAALFKESVLVVNQKAKIFGSKSEYAVFDQEGQRLAAVQETGNRMLRNALGVGQYGEHKFQIVDPSGDVLILLHRPSKMMKSRMIVVGADGTQGEIAQQTLGVIGTVRFSLEARGQVLGWMKAASKAAWDFSIQDATETEIARITKTWAGWAKERFTKADNYVVQIHKPLEEPLRSLVIAAALAVDTALKEGRPTTARRA